MNTLLLLIAAWTICSALGKLAKAADVLADDLEKRAAKGRAPTQNQDG